MIVYSKGISCIWWPLWNREKMGEETTGSIFKTGQGLPYRLEWHLDVLDRVEAVKGALDEARLKSCWTGLCDVAVGNPPFRGAGYPAATPRLVLEELKQPAVHCSLFCLRASCEKRRAALVVRELIFNLREEGLFRKIQPAAASFSPSYGTHVGFKFCMCTARIDQGFKERDSLGLKCPKAQQLPNSWSDLGVLLSE